MRERERGGPIIYCFSSRQKILNSSTVLKPLKHCRQCSSAMVARPSGLTGSIAPLLMVLMVIR